MPTTPDADPDDVLRPVSPAEDRQVTCGVCGQPGVLEELDPVRGFLISHPDRIVACRAPANPPRTADGVLDVPVEVSPN